MYCGQGLNLLPDCVEKPKQITITGERMIFTQSDMDSSNFGIDKQGRTVLLDFAHIMLLPESFACYTMASKAKFIADVAKSSKFNWSKTSNLTSMGRVCGCLWMAADTTLGAVTCGRNGCLTDIRHRPEGGRPAGRRYCIKTAKSIDPLYSLYDDTACANKGN
jgi:hypothetical protein